MKPHCATISEYIAQFPKPTQKLLKSLRQSIKDTAPMAVEKIAYGIPTFALNGNLVHFAAYSKHIGFYPGSAAIVVFKKDLLGYKTAKGTVQFPIDKPLPLALIQKIVRYRVTTQAISRSTA